MKKQRISSLLKRGALQSLSQAPIYALNGEEHLFGVTLTNANKSTHCSTENKTSTLVNNKRSQISREENHWVMTSLTHDFPRVALVASIFYTSSDWCATFDLISRCNGSVGFGLVTEIRLTAYVFWAYDWTLSLHFFEVNESCHSFVEPIIWLRNKLNSLFILNKETRVLSAHCRPILAYVCLINVLYWLSTTNKTT